MSKVMPVGTGEVAISYKNLSDTEQYKLILGLDPQDVPTTASIGAAVAAFCGELDDRWSSSYSFTGWEFEFQVDSSQISLFSGTLNIVGDLGTAVDKQNTCLLIRKNTALGGKVGKGRMYLSGVLNADSTDGGVLTAGALAAWNLDVAAALTALATAGFPMVLFHDVAVGHPLHGVATPVTSLSVDPVLATQRRRLRR